jgi:hypothetical protein
VITEQSQAADAFVIGRVTFEQVREYWPRQTDDATGVTYDRLPGSAGR